MSADILREFTRPSRTVRVEQTQWLDTEAMAETIEALREEVAEQRARVASLELMLWHAERRGEPEHRRDG